MKLRLSQPIIFGITFSALLMLMHLGAQFLKTPFLEETARDKQQVKLEELRLIQKNLEQSLHSAGKSVEFDAIKTISKWEIFENQLNDYGLEFDRQRADLSEKKREIVFLRAVSSLSTVFAGFILGTFLGIRRQVAKMPNLSDETQSGTAEHGTDGNHH